MSLSVSVRVCLLWNLIGNIVPETNYNVKCTSVCEPTKLSAACYLANMWHVKWVIVWCAVVACYQQPHKGKQEVDKSQQVRQRRTICKNMCWITGQWTMFTVDPDIHLHHFTCSGPLFRSSAHHLSRKTVPISHPVPVSHDTAEPIQYNMTCLWRTDDYFVLLTEQLQPCWHKYFLSDK